MSSLLAGIRFGAASDEDDHSKKDKKKKKDSKKKDDKSSSSHKKKQKDHDVATESTPVSESTLPTPTSALPRDEWMHMVVLFLN
ncbi:hypothetical protein AaE_000765, partial [Aphanomyces astaci]